MLYNCEGKCNKVTHIDKIAFVYYKKVLINLSNLMYSSHIAISNRRAGVSKVFSWWAN